MLILMKELILLFTKMDRSLCVDVLHLLVESRRRFVHVSSFHFSRTNILTHQVLGAHRAGIKTVILPLANKKDVEHDITLEVRQHIKVIFVHTIEDVIDAAFGKGKVLNRLHSNILVDSRL
jgi:hypothetical protein